MTIKDNLLSGALHADDFSTADHLQLEKSQPQAAPSKKKWKWQVLTDTAPKEIYNWTLYFCIFVFGVLGGARGLDEGGISGCLALPSFRNRFGLNDKSKSALQLANLKSNIAAMVQLGSIGGALIASYSVDKLGRVRALQCLCVVWIVGAIIQITAKDVGQLYAGRLIEGLAIGQTTTVGPAFTSEVSPSAIRGLSVSIFSGAVYFGIMMGYFTSYGSVLHISSTSDKQWMVVVSLKIILAGLVFIMSFFVLESPRWLIKKDRQEQAVQNLTKLRHLPADHPYVLGEISDITNQCLLEKQELSKATPWLKVRELVMVKSNRYCFFAVAIMAQILGQWSGSNAITIYALSLFSLAGIKGSVNQLKMLAILGVVKFVLAYASAFFLIDFLGRRRSLYIGLGLQLACILYFAIFLTILPQAEKSSVILTGSDDRAAKGALAALFLSGCGWTMGFNNIQYLLGSEIFPLRIRSFAQSMVMVLHFANQYGNSKALPKMLLAMNNYGAFYFFVGIMAIGLFWCWFFVPEVAGRSLESMEEMFNLPWYQIGRHGPELCPDHSEVHKISHAADKDMNLLSLNLYMQEKAEQEFIENASQENEMMQSLEKPEEAYVENSQQPLPPPTTNNAKTTTDVSETNNGAQFVRKDS